MKKSTKFLFMLSLICIYFGFIAIIVEDKNGGLKIIKEATGSQQIKKRFSPYKQLGPKLNTRDKFFKPSKGK
ncbi:DUF4097 family beta strand repeat-containing protein, partial [Streptococcus pluranimalium]